ncbi:MAG: hypothetical protein WBX14_05285 [Candidatus Udaeobacter sp.]
MTPASRWLKLLLKMAGIAFVVLVAGFLTLFWLERSGERTYYGPHTDILNVGEHVLTSEGFTPPGHAVIPKAPRGIVQSDPAWDEDSCDPDRPINLRLDSGEVISVPRHILHR